MPAVHACPEGMQGLQALRTGVHGQHACPAGPHAEPAVLTPFVGVRTPVYSPKNPPEDPLTDAISQGPQGLQPLEAWALLAETNGSSSWEHRSHLLRPTASAAGTIGLNLRGQQLQQLKPLVSVSKTDGFRS
ncbi:hypothetical protein PCASD_14325 [Puccinia coronata f. sp. avenae]|uniref:Uncharacterized protein n=1 Tax=Puccinia coronata f. sp. avenae TaxID=200324 RepID=A0A2N5U3Q6_9BASI|nr:hypothetical protein PCASD_14325 [Puccinia coronata f. sp. avenae]